MKYYRVKSQYDNETRFTWNNHHQGVSNGILIANELYTPKEYEKLANCPLLYWQGYVKKSNWFQKVSAITIISSITISI